MYQAINIIALDFDCVFSNCERTDWGENLLDHNCKNNDVKIIHRQIIFSNIYCVCGEAPTKVVFSGLGIWAWSWCRLWWVQPVYWSSSSHPPPPPQLLSSRASTEILELKQNSNEYILWLMKPPQILLGIRQWNRILDSKTKKEDYFSNIIPTSWDVKTSLRRWVCKLRGGPSRFRILLNGNEFRQAPEWHNILIREY